jgi:hypothetical protein
LWSVPHCRFRSINYFIALIFVFGCTGCKESFTKECRGNLETYHQEIIQAGVSYNLHYDLHYALFDESTAQVHFAGRDFAAEAKKNSVWDEWHLLKLLGMTMFFHFRSSQRPRFCQ